MSKTFSESWYRVANERISLRPGVRVRRQNFRGERWIVLENPFSNEFFRLRPAAYEFVSRLRSDRTVEAAWRACVEKFPDEAPSQEAVIQLLAQLYYANLLQYELAADSAQLFQRFKKRRQRERGFRLLNIMFMRFPLFDPDRLLVSAMPFIKWVVSPAGALLWLIVVGFGLKVVADNFDAIRVEGQDVLSPGNLLLLYAGMVFVKTLHEFGHAAVCRRFGGEVHVMGVMLMIFTPMPYVDATSSWGFRERWKRILVGGAGMIVEVFVAAIAAFVWANTGPGVLHNLSYNIMFVASVSTLIFNLNPLLRFDGYYILSDILEIPNLNQRAMGQLRHVAESRLFGVKVSESPARNSREAAWYASYGVASGIYRVIVFSGILLAVADRFLILGIVMALICVISWVTVPLFRFAKYLASSPRLERVRPRAVAVALGGIATIILLLAVVPFPRGVRAPGIVEAAERTHVATETAGEVKSVLTKSGTEVQAGQPLLKLVNHELELELAHAKARLAEIDARLLKAMNEGSADVKPLSELKQSVSVRIAKLQDDMDRLTVRARHAGIWVAPELETFVGRWIPRGYSVGLLVNPASFEFAATVLQEDADALFDQRTRRAQVRLHGDAHVPIQISEWKVVPGGQRTLPSPALGWRGGGDVPVGTAEAEANKSVEPFFEVLGKLEPRGEISLLDGRSGKIRFELEPEPLLPRWLRRLFQLFQKRYQI